MGVKERASLVSATVLRVVGVGVEVAAPAVDDTAAEVVSGLKEVADEEAAPAEDEAAAAVVVSILDEEGVLDAATADEVVSVDKSDAVGVLVELPLKMTTDVAVSTPVTVVV